MILSIIFIKYRPVYEVYLDGESIGFVNSKKEMEDIINNEILISDNPCIISTELNIEPSYEFRLANIKETNEDEIKQRLLNETITMYKVYAINLNNEVKAYVNTWDEAEEVVNQMKTEYEDIVDTNITVTEKYTDSIESLAVTQIADAEYSINSQLRTIKTEQEKINEATCNGVYFSIKPVSGNITSRYGATESIRSHSHKGLDIAASTGTPIKAVAKGTISYAGWMSGYGYLVIINHANGVQTYYGHCSKLYVSEGKEVSAGDTIAAVGATGDATGSHLHFEIRIDGEQIDPQEYLYK